jgi:DNA-binding transcriptional ArsR family regulator
VRYTLQINQKQAIELGIKNVNQVLILHLIGEASSWAEPIIDNSEVFYWVSRTKIIEEIPLLNIKPDTAYRHLKSLVELGLIDYIKQGKKDLVKLTKKGRSYYVGNKSESDDNSEINPSKLGNKSEKNSEINPTYNNTNSNTSTNDTFKENKQTKQNVEIVSNAEQDFELFWSHYPIKKAKQNAKKIFIKIYKELPQTNELIGTLETFKQTEDWMKERGKYIPHPSTWLNGRRWEDEITPQQVDVISQTSNFGMNVFDVIDAMEERENQEQVGLLNG